MQLIVLRGIHYRDAAAPVTAPGGAVLVPEPASLAGTMAAGFSHPTLTL